MKQLASLAWKEWYEIRALFAIALFVFLGLPLIGALEYRLQSRYFQTLASPWVFYLGGLLSIFMAVGTVSRDFAGRLEEFWRSRPVRLGRWLLVKYLVALVATLIALTLPLIMDFASNRVPTFLGTPPQLVIATICPFLWVALFSVGFVTACLLRRAAHAAMLSIAIGLLLYFLPEVIPPLSFLSFTKTIETSLSWPRESNWLPITWFPGLPFFGIQQLEFAIGMLVLSAIALIVSLLIVRRDWHVESNRKLVYWSIGGSLLIIFSSAAFQVGTNLPLLKTIELPAREEVQLVRTDGHRGIMISARFDKFPVQRVLRRLQISGTDIQIGPAIAISFGHVPEVWPPLWLPDHPDLLYFSGIVGPKNATSEQWYPTLTVVGLKESVADATVQSYPELASDGWWGAPLYAWHDRLYLVGPKILTFDISRPVRPRLISTELRIWRTPAGDWQWRRDDEIETAEISLPQVPGLPPRQRLEMVATTWVNWRAPNAHLADDIVTRGPGQHLTNYRLESLTDTMAMVRKLGTYDPTPVEWLCGNELWETAASDGLFFESTGNPKLGTGAHVSVFDVTAGRPHPVGHFALPRQDRFHALCPLPDGRLLAVSGNHLYLLGAPPGKRRPL